MVNVHLYNGQMPDYCVFLYPADYILVLVANFHMFQDFPGKKQYDENPAWRYNQQQAAYLSSAATRT